MCVCVHGCVCVCVLCMSTGLPVYANTHTDILHTPHTNIMDKIAVVWIANDPSLGMGLMLGLIRTSCTCCAQNNDYVHTYTYILLHTATFSDNMSILPMVNCITSVISDCN